METIVHLPLTSDQNPQIKTDEIAARHLPVVR